MTAEGSLSFRAAFDSDWPSVWRIIHATLSEADTYPYLPSTSEADARRIWMSDPDSARVAYVAEADGGVVATAYMKPNQPGLGDHIANAGWMVDRTVRGKGVGRQFAGYILDEARRSGYLGMQFNSVVSTNKAAIALWESIGFRIVGTVPRAFRHPTAGPVAIHVMYIDL